MPYLMTRQGISEYFIVFVLFYDKLRVQLF